MSVRVVEHAIAADCLAVLRARDTGTGAFRQAADRIATILVVAATARLPLHPADVETPLERTAVQVCTSRVVFVPVLRAGLSLLPSALALVPGASVGMVGVERDEATASPRTYYSNIPDASGAAVLILDPMLATGGSAAAAVTAARAAGAADIALACVVAAPEGIASLEAQCPGVDIVTAAVDRELNRYWYILPGLGDYGDRYFGT